MKYKCIIIDDEELAIKVVKGHIAKVSKLEVLDTFTNPIDASSIINEGNVDVIFLDINLPIISGLDFFKSLNNPPLVVITTAYREYAVESFELDILDYLVKPIPFNRFLKTVNKICRALPSKSSYIDEDREHIFVKIDKKMLKIYLDEILFIESLKDYIKVNTTTGSHLIHQTLTSFTESLPSDVFIRVHRSFTASIRKVDAILGNLLEIEGTQIPIGPNYVQEVKKVILD